MQTKSSHHCHQPVTSSNSTWKTSSRHGVFHKVSMAPIVVSTGINGVFHLVVTAEVDIVVSSGVNGIFHRENNANVFVSTGIHCLLCLAVCPRTTSGPVASLEPSAGTGKRSITTVGTAVWFSLSRDTTNFQLYSSQRQTIKGQKQHYIYYNSNTTIISILWQLIWYKPISESGKDQSLNIQKLAGGWDSKARKEIEVMVN